MPKLHGKQHRKKVPLLPKLVGTVGDPSLGGTTTVVGGTTTVVGVAKSARSAPSTSQSLVPLPPGQTLTARNPKISEDTMENCGTTPTSVVTLPPIEAVTNEIGANGAPVPPLSQVSPRPNVLALSGSKASKSKGKDVRSMGTLHDGSVALWPSKVTENNKPELLIQLELKVREGQRILEGATNATVTGGVSSKNEGHPEDIGCTPDQVANLRLAIVLDVLQYFKKAFKVYLPIFESVTELIEGVCGDVATLQHKYSAVTSEFYNLGGQISAQFKKSKWDEHELLKKLEAKQQKIDALDKLNVQEPQVFERMMKQQRGTIDELKRKLQFLEERDDELSAALVTRAITIDNLEGKVFELARERDELLKEIDGHLEEKKRKSMEIEQVKYQSEQEVKDAETKSRHSRAAMQSLKANLEAEITRLKQQQEQVKTKNQSKFFLGDYDWTEFCEDQSENMHTHDQETGEKLKHISELKLNERIEMVVNLWKESQLQLVNIEQKIQEGGLVLQGSAAAQADGDGTATTITESSLATNKPEKFFLNAVTQQSSLLSPGEPTSPFSPAANSSAFSTGGSELAAAVVPPFLCWKVPGPVIGYDMTEGEVVSLLGGFFEVHKKLVRTGSFTTTTDCINQWIQGKFLQNYNKRIAFSYSFLHSVENLHSTRNLEVHQFIALLHNDCPGNAFMKRSELVMELRAAMESRQARKMSTVAAVAAAVGGTITAGVKQGIPLIAATAILKKVLHWYTESEIEALMDEGIRCQPLSKQSSLDVDLLFQPQSPFLRKVCRQHLYKTIADGRLLREAVMSINPTHLNVAGGSNYTGAMNPLYEAQRGNALNSHLMQVGQKSGGGPAPPAVPIRGKRANAEQTTTLPPCAVPHVRAGDVISAWRKADPGSDPEHLKAFLMNDVLHWQEKEISAGQGGAALSSSTHSPDIGSPLAFASPLAPALSFSSSGLRRVQSKVTVMEELNSSVLDGNAQSVRDGAFTPGSSYRAIQVFPAEAMIDRNHLMAQLRSAFFFSRTNGPIPEYILPSTSVMNIVETSNPYEASSPLGAGSQQPSIGAVFTAVSATRRVQALASSQGSPTRKSIYK